MLKVGDKIVTVHLQDGKFEVSKEETITHVGSKQFWTGGLRSRCSMAFYFDGTGRIPVPNAPIQYTPRPFAYCLKENVKITKVVLTEVFNKAQSIRARALTDLLATTGLMEPPK